MFLCCPVIMYVWDTINNFLQLLTILTVENNETIQILREVSKENQETQFLVVDYINSEIQDFQTLYLQLFLPVYVVKFYTNLSFWYNS